MGVDPRIDTTSRGEEDSATIKVEFVEDTKRRLVTAGGLVLFWVDSVVDNLDDEAIIASDGRGPSG